MVVTEEFYLGVVKTWDCYSGLARVVLSKASGIFIVLTGHVLRRLDLSYMTHYPSPMPRKSRAYFEAISLLPKLGWCKPKIFSSQNFDIQNQIKSMDQSLLGCSLVTSPIYSLSIWLCINSLPNNKNSNFRMIWRQQIKYGKNVDFDQKGLKIMWGKMKILVTNLFSFPHNVLKNYIVMVV